MTLEWLLISYMLSGPGIERFETRDECERVAAVLNDRIHPKPVGVERWYVCIPARDRGK